MIPGLWLNEGGQSTTGKLVKYFPCFKPIPQNCQTYCFIFDHENNLLNIFVQIDHVLQIHPAYSWLVEDAKLK